MKKLKDLRFDILQNIANNIIERMKNTENKKELEILFIIGMRLNMWCVIREIYLN